MQNYGNYGHATCGRILEKVEEDCGVVDTEYYINTEASHNIMKLRLRVID